MFDDLMNDRVTIRTRSGKTYTDVAASVQRGKILTQRTDIPIEPGDEIVRRTPAGVDEVFVVDDPGLHTGMGDIPATYQMTVRRGDVTSSSSGGVIYNVSGPNARFNINSVDASTNVISQTPPELFQTIREVIQSRVSGPERDRLLAGIGGLERETEKKDFAHKYAQFIELAANHMDVLGPFLPALMQLLLGR